MDARPCCLTASACPIEPVGKLCTPVGVGCVAGAVAVRTLADRLRESSRVAPVSLKLVDAIVY